MNVDDTFATMNLLCEDEFARSHDCVAGPAWIFKARYSGHATERIERWFDVDASALSDRCRSRGLQVRTIHGRCALKALLGSAGAEPGLARQRSFRRCSR